MNLISQTSAFQSGDLEKAYSKKTWDAAEYIYWGIISLLIGFFILEFFVLKTTWNSSPFRICGYPLFYHFNIGHRLL
jgi:hypothetical protein